ncbi:MAG: hypothetical protein ACOY82_15805 [Pseudomonadota bacterium]
MNPFRFFAALLSFAALQFSVPVAAEPIPVKEGEGVVFFHDALNFPALNTGGSGLTVQVLRVDGEAKKHILTMARGGMQTSSAYYAALPAGRYKLYDFDADPECWAWVCKYAIMPPIQTMPDFEVRAGEVSYLGPIQVSITSAWGAPPEERKVTWGWDETPDLDLGRRVFAGLQSTLADMPVRVGWAESRAPGHDQRWRWSIIERSQGMALAGLYGADGFYFSAQNGVIKRWRPGGDVEMLYTGSPFLLESVLEMTGGRLLAAGEAGTLRRSSDDGRTWSDFNATLPYGRISNLIDLGDGNAFAFARLWNGSVYVYRGTLDTGAFVQLAAFELDISIWNGPPDYSPRMFRDRDRLVVSIPSRKLALIDLTTGAAELLDAPGAISNFTLNPDGGLWCICAQNLLVHPYVSRDLGRTWEKSEGDRLMVMAAFFDEQRGFGYRSAVFSEKNSGIVRTTDGGRNWSLTNDPDIDRAFWTPAYSRDGSVMLLNSLRVIGAFGITITKYSVDGGDAWSPVPRGLSWKYVPQI